MSRGVKLLLLLSALLSALSGATAGTRTSQPTVAVARAAESVAAVRTAAALAAGRPAASLPPLGMTARAVLFRTWTIAAAVPLYLSRRRE